MARSGEGSEGAKGHSKSAAVGHAQYPRGRGAQEGGSWSGYPSGGRGPTPGRCQTVGYCHMGRGKAGG